MAGSTAMEDGRLTPEAALRRWGVEVPARVAPDAGLINQTWLVGDPPVAVLQWVNPIFRPSVHQDILAVTERLASRGLLTPRLLPTLDGALWVDDVRGCWRLQSHVPGRTCNRLDTPERARACGGLVGRFHAAVAGWDYTFQHVRPGAHDTPAHMELLRATLQRAEPHPLHGPARRVGEEILARWTAWSHAKSRLDLPLRVCHGDLKVSNLRFDEAGTEAICLLDLDTLSALPLAVELGDAWRSWCNPAGEDDPESSVFDLDLFEASTLAWAAEAPPLTPEEWESLVPGIERICLELSARFCADALRNSYFREDRERFPEPGAHNLLRARGQLALAASARDRAEQAARILRRGAPRLS